MDTLADTLLDLVLFLLNLGTVGLSVSWALLHGLKPRMVVLVGALTMAFLAFAMFFLPQWGSHQDWISQASNYFFDQNSKDKAWNSYFEAMVKWGWDAGQIVLLKDFYINYFYLSALAWQGIRCLLWGLGAYYFLSSVLSKVTPRVSRPIVFREWMVPESLIFGLIIAGALKLFARQNSPVDIVGDNLLVFFVGFYTLAGFSIVSFFLYKWKLPKALRIIGYFVIFWLPLNPYCLFGILDVWFDFRKLKGAPEGAAT